MNSLTSKVTVIGLGYVGLPLALVMADKGAEVNGFDTNQNKINLLNSGATFLDEEELINLWNKNNKKIKFSSSFIKSDVYLIAVPTPLEEGKITCDMKYIDEAIHVISNNLII